MDVTTDLSDLSKAFMAFGDVFSGISGEQDPKRDHISIKLISLFTNFPNNTQDIIINKTDAVEELTIIGAKKLKAFSSTKGLLLCKETGKILNEKNKIWEEGLDDNYTVIWGDAEEILDMQNYSKLLPKIPIQILQQETKHILNYLQDIESEETGRPHKLLECKMAFLGMGFVGKTSLINILRTGTYDAESQKTDGIEITDWSVKRDHDSVKVNIWDFGGQEITKLIHKLFLTERTIYVLVTTLRRTDYLGQPDLERWLRLVNQYAPQSPVIVVVNKIDEESRDTLNRVELRSQYPQIVDFVKTSCIDCYGIDELKKAILQAVRHLPHLDNLLSATFNKVKKEIQKEIKNYLKFQEYEEKCRKVNPQITEEDVRSIIELLNDLGVMLYISKGRLKDTSVIKTEWIVKGIFQVLNSELIRVNFGKIPEVELLDLLDKNLFITPEDGRILLNFMIHFHFCYRITDGVVENGFNDFIYFFPSFFRPEVPANIGSPPPDSLIFIFKYQDLSEELFLIFVIKNYYRLREYWLTGCLYTRSEEGENINALIVTDRKNSKVIIKIYGHGNKRLLLDILRDEFKDIHKTLNIPAASITEFILDYITNEIEIDFSELIRCEKNGRKTYYVSQLNKDLLIKKLLYGLDKEPVVLNKYKVVVTLIKGGKVDEAIENFDTKISNYPLSKSQATEWILLHGQYNNIKNEKITISRDDYLNRINIWTKYFLDFINTLV